MLSVIRYAIVAVILGWFGILCQADDIIIKYPLYDPFEIIGTAEYWRWWCGGLSVLAVAGLMPWFYGWRAFTMAVQGAWWFNATYRFSLETPWPTAVAVYPVLAAICFCGAWFSLRTGKD